MRLPLPCVVCSGTAIVGVGGGQLVFVAVELEGDSLFRVTCPEGHSSTVGLAQPSFKILYESGALALLDGYYREAVGSFASAVERFYEHWVRATLLQQGVSDDAIDATWKVIAKRSESQFGAFLFLYLRERGKLPPHQEKWKEFRNDVVHAGKFPTKAKTIDYARAALEHIVSLQSDLQEHAPRGEEIVYRRALDSVERANCDLAVTIETVVGRAGHVWPNAVNFEEELSRLDSRRRGEGGEPRGGAPTSAPSRPGG